MDDVLWSVPCCAASHLLGPKAACLLAGFERTHDDPKHCVGAAGVAEPDADAASASADLPAAPEMALTQHLWRGLLPSECVERLIDAGRGLLAAGACPWAAVSVWCALSRR